MATQIYEISKKQSLLDACIQVYGTSKLLFRFAKDNGLQIDSGVNIGDSLLYDDELGDQDLKNKIEGENFIINNPGVEVISEYKAVYDAFINKPPSSIAYNQNIFVTRLVNGKVWYKLDWIGIFAGHTNLSAESLLDWISAVKYGNAVNSPVYTALEGFDGDGLMALINSNYNASVDGVNYTKDSASFGFYVRSNIAENLADAGALSGNNRMYIYARRPGDTSRYVANDNSAIAFVSGADARGMYVSVRDNSGNRTFYKNKVVLNSAAIPSVGIPNADFTFLGLPPLGSYSSKQLSIGFMGGALTQDDVTILTDAFEEYMDSNGKGVL